MNLLSRLLQRTKVPPIDGDIRKYEKWHFVVPHCKTIDLKEELNSIKDHYREVKIISHASSDIPGEHPMSTVILEAAE